MNFAVFPKTGKAFGFVNRISVKNGKPFQTELPNREAYSLGEYPVIFLKEREKW